MKKIFRQLHLWLSVPFGIVIAVICFSGAMLVFEKEITAAVSQSDSVSPSADGPMQVNEVVAAVVSSLPDSVSVTGVTIPSDPNKAWQVALSQPRRASVYVDQYTGRVLGRSERLGFFTVMFGLHRWLLMAPTGKTIVGISTIVFVLVLISGIVVWWPRNKKALVNSLKIDASHGWPRLWHGLHVAGGMYAIVFLLAMALTGLTWSFPWYRTGFYALFGANTEQSQGAGSHGSHAEAPKADAHGKRDADHAPFHGGQPPLPDSAMMARMPHHADGQHQPMPPHDGGMMPDSAGMPPHRRGFPPREGMNRPDGFAPDGAHAPMRDSDHAKGDAHTGATQKKDVKAPNFHKWNKVYKAVAKNYETDGYASISIRDGSASVSLGGLGNQRASDTYKFDKKTGKITSSTLYADADRASKLRGWIFSVHVGSWGGLLTRVLAFLAALLGASLPLTGYYLWIKRTWGRKS